MSLREMIWDVTTRIVADTIALVSPRAAVNYRNAREEYKRSYVAARTKGAYQKHRPTNRSGDAEVLADRERVTGNVRDMVRNNPLVAGMVYKLPTMVVGDEIGFKAQVIGRDGKPATAINKDIERRFYRWAEHCGLSNESLTDIAYLIESHLLQDGEVLQRDVMRKSAKIGQNPYRLQVLETDYLDKAEGTYGVFYDLDGVAVAYQVYNRHPQAAYDPNDPGLQSKKEEAALFRLLVESDRASQRRGISRFAPAVYKLHGVDDLEDAELVASRSAAAFGLIITSPQPIDLSITGEEPTDEAGKPRRYLEAGGVYEAMPGEEVKAFSSDRPNSNFDSFTRGRKRDSAGSVGMSYESATGDYSQVNYSSARMGKIVEWSTIKRRQRRLRQWLKEVVRKWLSIEVSTVGIPGIDMADYAENPERYDDFSFQLAGNDGIDPLKEIKAFEAELAMGVNSRTDYCAERGRDFPEILLKQSTEKTALEAAGLWIQPGKPANGPPALPKESPDQDEEAPETPDEQPDQEAEDDEEA